MSCAPRPSRSSAPPAIRSSVGRQHGAAARRGAAGVPRRRPVPPQPAPARSRWRCPRSAPAGRLPRGDRGRRAPAERGDRRAGAGRRDLAVERGGAAAGAARDHRDTSGCRRRRLHHVRQPDRGPGGGPVLAQTVDLNGDLDDQIAVLDVERAGSPRRVAGAELRRAARLPRREQRRPGHRPEPGARRRLAARPAALPGHPAPAGQRGQRRRGAGHPARAAAGQLALADLVRPSQPAWVEILGDDASASAKRPRQRTPITSCIPTSPRGTSSTSSPATSRALRLKTGQAALDGLPAAGASVEDHFALLSRPPICVAGTGDIRRERTVAAVVMLPDRGELHVRPGDPSRSATQSFGCAGKENQSMPVSTNSSGATTAAAGWFVPGRCPAGAPRLLLPARGRQPAGVPGLAGALGEDAEIWWPSAAPGREHRAAEPAPPIAELIDGAAAAITALTRPTTGRVYLFGHSLGGTGRVRGCRRLPRRGHAASLRRVGLLGALAAALQRVREHRQPGGKEFAEAMGSSAACRRGHRRRRHARPAAARGDRGLPHGGRVPLPARPPLAVPATLVVGPRRPACRARGATAVARRVRGPAGRALAARRALLLRHAAAAVTVLLGALIRADQHVELI